MRSSGSAQGKKAWKRSALPRKEPAQIKIKMCSMRGLSPRPMAHRTIALTTELMEHCWEKQAETYTGAGKKRRRREKNEKKERSPIFS